MIAILICGGLLALAIAASQRAQKKRAARVNAQWIIARRRWE
jgi:hypothetical protein